MISPDLDSAQVRIPPPVGLIVVLLLGAALKLLLPTPFLSEGVRWIFGSIVLLLGIALLVWCVSLFRVRETNVEPWKPTLRILREGPYRFSRNPIYVSFLMVAAGALLPLDNWASLGLLVPVFCFLKYYVIYREERYLAQKFGSSYADFKSTTRRWI